MPQSDSIVIWLIRDFAKTTDKGDAKLTISRTRTGYTANYHDRELDVQDSLSFDAVADVHTYMDLFFLNLGRDKDVSNPFECVQYIIPGFPSVVQGVATFNDEDNYKLFIDTVHFYLDHAL